MFFGCRCNLCWLTCCEEFWDGKDDWDTDKTCLTNLETGYTREAFASFPQVSEEDTL